LSKTYDELKRAEYSRQVSNVVAADLRINGEISGNEDLLVEGIVEGLIQLGDGMLTVGATGRIAADVVAREIVVYGEVRGNLVARDRIEIKKEGSMVGDLTTARFIIEDGANFRGSIEIIGRDTSSHAFSPTIEGEEQHSRALTAAGSLC
jgi:cytoskeletal protein CcmA (bactofilin family)